LPGDLAVFMIDLMQAHQGEAGHLSSPETARQMTFPQIEIPNGAVAIGF
jgi:hypothetical protein